MGMHFRTDPPGWRWVFPRYVMRNDKRVYPKRAQTFAFLVRTHKK